MAKIQCGRNNIAKLDNIAFNRTLSVSPMQAKYVLCELIANLAEVRDDLFTERALSKLFLRIGRSGHTSPPGFTYPPSIMEFSHAIWCRWSAKGCASPWESKKPSGAQSFTLDSLFLSLSLSFSFFLSRPASRDYWRGIPRLFCVWAIGALYMVFHGLLPCYPLPRFHQQRLSQMTPIRDHSFRRTVTRECKDRMYTSFLMTRCNALRLLSVPLAMHNTRDARCCKSVSLRVFWCGGASV